ncbi:type II toxin-antitoxin system RatA family toxin [uncultured Pseudoteredinibacter sp.]|uniref:type II toxin-antitoxin system RatA family toxin n=1 Tax=uncultured Pseudoteredinibacter sp. TaxID=1641701 RepID=UPI0026394408|nr:type II toxin-antitoxin system RatA family toxin [uncultured Pseudoteredinibacter sp.]
MATEIERSALVAYSQEQMFELVGDIESYPQFMPGCVAAEVHQQGEDFVEASLYLSQAGIKQQFTTRNILERPGKMLMSLVAGPFSELSGEWRFIPLAENACKVELSLRFGFDNAVLKLAAGKLFEKSANQQVAALCQRAEQVYGPSKL